MRKIFEWSWKDPQGNISTFETDSLADLIDNIDGTIECIRIVYGDDVVDSNFYINRESNEKEEKK